MPNEVKIIVDDVEYPSLGSDSHGYVLHISSPRRVGDNLLNLHGMFFDEDQKGRSSLWHMFRASVYHLTLHTVVTDFRIYRDLANNAHMNNAMFAISLAEDYAIRGYQKARWPGLVFDTAYANHLSALRFRDLKQESDLATKMAANLLSYSMVGAPIVQNDSKMAQEVESTHAALLSLQNETSNTVASQSKGTLDPVIPSQIPRVSEMKVAAAKRIVWLFEENSAYLRDVHSLPYTDNHGSNYLFENTITTHSPEQRTETLRAACQELSIDLSEKRLKELEKNTEIESQTILADWEYSLSIKERIVEMHKELDPNSHFENIIFPSEDYAEFVRTRSKLIGPIRRVLDQLRMIKSTTDEVGGMESGYIDIPTAIQVVATKSARNDVFIREEFDKKSEAWGILVDCSKSLEGVQGEVKDILVCLTEVARDLISSPSSWGCYAFNENLYVVKDFSELYGNSVKGRIGGLKSGIKTYLPDALRMAAKRLSRTTEEIKVLLVASDGFPLGYDGIDNDLLEAIEQITKSGILLIGLGVGSSSIKKYFRSNCVVSGPFDLMKHFVRTYLELSSLF